MPAHAMQTRLQAAFDRLLASDTLEPEHAQALGEIADTLVEAFALERGLTTQDITHALEEIKNNVRSLLVKLDSHNVFVSERIHVLSNAIYAIELQHLNALDAHTHDPHAHTHERPL